MAASSIRFGPGSTQEVGMDFANMKAKNVLVITDKIIRNLHPMKTATEALERAGIKFEVFDDVRTEPKDYSYGWPIYIPLRRSRLTFSRIKAAIEFGKKFDADAFLAVGGGSVMDTAKLTNLYCSFPDADFLDFVSIIRHFFANVVLIFSRSMRP